MEALARGGVLSRADFNERVGPLHLTPCSGTLRCQLSRTQCARFARFVGMLTISRAVLAFCIPQVVDALRCLPSEAALRALNHLGQAVSSIQISTVRSVPAYIMSIIAKHQPGREGRLRDPPRKFPTLLLCKTVAICMRTPAEPLMSNVMLLWDAQPHQ